ncbi:MAG: hypothetical protein Satyrvirus2_21 [Satyrvirus sp.]|uniref:Uncharacterized protein n=1 Tax=Satyrvirus sp. TaxID=2487771 RepID=A0A3G5ACV9_9VIRU|nr:MAG: hypothetical protein Satyrvirus2_21 [Satyrvirus sp.]
MEKIPIYYEQCNKNTMAYYPFFIRKLKEIQKLTKINTLRDVQSNILPEKKYYKLGNIVWNNSVVHKIEFHKNFPSEYFVKVILNTCIIDKNIINPPLQINPDQISSFSYISLGHNKLLIIDALMEQGSHPRYLLPGDTSNEKFIYSEHSGAISIKNGVIDNIIVSAATDRTDINDSTIFLPTNTPIFLNYEYIFHTHPNTSAYAGRLEDGIIYEFPSANDILNFVKYYNEGKVQASIIVGPEGIYVIRQIMLRPKYEINHEIFDLIKKFILKLEKIAIKNIKSDKYVISNISDPDVFHENVSYNFKYIKMYNDFIKKWNIFIEFYPRYKKNNEWCLRPISLPFVF